MKKFGSQGQQKSYLIALKLAQFAFIKKKKEIKYLRERVRKAKLSNANQQASLEKKLKAAIDSTMEEQVGGSVYIL